MARRIAAVSELGAVKRSIISDYVRLSLGEGGKPGEAYRELKRKLNKVTKLKNPI